MVKFNGVADKAALFIQKEQLFDTALWSKFVDVFRSQPDSTDRGWKCEYWGKMMRGGALVYEYTRDQRLYDILTDTIKDILTVAEFDGRVSGYSRETEFDGWDLWGRKYVLLGCEYYLDICKDDALKQNIIYFMCRCADYIVENIGSGKKEITSASRHWFGMNSSSILEPIVKLYNITECKKYLNFASYIVECGGVKGINIFQLAYENKLYPYQYGVSKAYEMMSCFEGLLEYYYVTGDEKYRQAVINFGNAVIKSEISIIGSCGITHELFDHTRMRQTVAYDGVMQETCVTVTWMKFCSRLLELTGDSIYADEMEKSFYNAYLGSINTEHKESKYAIEKKTVSTFLPFDSYSPLTPGVRGKKVGGFQILPDNSYYGCCACIGAAGVGVFLKNAIICNEKGVFINFFEAGAACLNYKGVDVNITVETKYPADGKIRLVVKSQKPVRFVLNIRSPGWSNLPSGYISYDREWHDDTIDIEYQMPLVFHTPEKWDQDIVYIDTSAKVDGFYTASSVNVSHCEQDDKYVAITRGPITLAADSRIGKAADSKFDFDAARENEIIEDAECIIKLKFADDNYDSFCLIDYASAGRNWESVIAAWLPIQ